MNEIFYKKKIVLIGILILFATIVTAAIYIGSIPINVMVKEPVHLQIIEINVTGYPGQGAAAEFIIERFADSRLILKPLRVQQTWHESSNPSNINYTISWVTTNQSGIYDNLPAGNTTSVIAFDIPSDSPLGSISGYVSIDRIA